jgi:N-acetylglucosaminyldiphosphoundecaprenol N-acetyl-beta-D-mannosaminyltransferase
VTDIFEPPVVASTPAASDVRRYGVCGVPIADVDTLAAAELIVEHAVAGTSYQVHLCNAFTLSLVDRDSRLRNALAASNLNLPDGTPVAWMGRGTTQGE